ncbi:MAG: ABC transporter permease [Bacteroidales bacterium]|nr:ABC transporter permease [Bacteroidales bacterium]
MKKTLLVIRREYMTRVRKRSFWVMTILVPLMLAVLYAVPIYLAMKPLEKAVVLVADESGLFGGLDPSEMQLDESRFASTPEVEYRYAATYDYAVRQMNEDDNITAILYIQRRASDAIPTDACLYYKRDLPPSNVRLDVDKQLTHILRNRLLMAHDISGDEYNLITNTKINLRTQDLETGRDAFLEVKTGLGIILAILIYMVIFAFGSQVMRGVVEEKTNRIVEVIVCSVKPFQLMMGKVVGIVLVGLTQCALWMALTGIALTAIQASNPDMFRHATEKHNITEIATKGSEATNQMEASAELADIPRIVEGISAIDFGTIVPVFLFYFLFGYLLYGTLFAAAGALCDNDTDTQLFSLPLTVPLLATILLLPALTNAPSGTLSQVLSIVPFTAPMAMMLRVPFGVPLTQLYWSMGLLVVTCPLCTWLASRIYRRTILRYSRRKKR